MKTTMKLSIFLPMAAVLTLGVAAVYAQESVKMTFSGTSGNSANNLQQPDTHVDEDVFAGTGTLGSFTLRNLRAILNSPTPSNTCSGPNDEPSGAGVFRFEDGSLLFVQLTRADDCIDYVHLVAHCTLIFQINGGTGRFSNAQGTLKLTETAGPVLFDYVGIPVYFAATGQITGTVWGVSGGQDQGGGQ